MTPAEEWIAAQGQPIPDWPFQPAYLWTWGLAALLLWWMLKQRGTR